MSSLSDPLPQRYAFVVFNDHWSWPVAMVVVLVVADLHPCGRQWSGSGWIIFFGRDGVGRHRNRWSRWSRSLFAGTMGRAALRDEDIIFIIICRRSSSRTLYRRFVSVA